MHRRAGRDFPKTSTALTAGREPIVPGEPDLRAEFLTVVWQSSACTEREALQGLINLRKRGRLPGQEGR